MHAYTSYSVRWLLAAAMLVISGELESRLKLASRTVVRCYIL
jgi:hypothetical protein